MKNYLNKGLIYKECKFLLPAILMYCINLIIMYIMPFTRRIEYLKEAISDKRYTLEYGFNMFDNFFNQNKYQIAIMLIVVVIATFIVGWDFSGRKYEVLSSMPFKKEDIIISKWIVGALGISIPMILTTGIINTIYLSNKAILKPFASSKVIFSWGFMNMLIYLFILTFIMLIQSLSGINVFGGIVGGIFLILPVALPTLIFAFARIFTLNPNLLTVKHCYAIEEKLLNFLGDIFLVGYAFELPFTAEVFKRFFILIVAIIITLILLIYSFKKVPLERSGYVVIFRPLEIIFKIGVSICFGLLGGVISGEILSSYNNIYSIDRGNIEAFLPIINKTIKLSVLIAILSGCIVYVITNKIIEINKK